MLGKRTFNRPKSRAGQWRDRFPNRDFNESEIEYLNTRYGKATTSWRGPGVLFALFGIPWLLWSASYHSNPEIRATLLNFQVPMSQTISDSGKPTIEIRYQVQRRNPERTITCTLVARDIDKNVVGEIADRIPSSTEKSIIRIVQIPARLTPVNAAVLDCR